MNACKELYTMERNLSFNDEKRQAWYNWILENGKEFTGRKLSASEEKELKLHLGHPLYRLGKCYYNSQILATGVGGYSYFEGYAVCEAIGFPLEHGFNVRDGKVFDATWCDGVEYFGVEIPVEYVRLWLLEDRQANTLLVRYYIEAVQASKP